MSEGHYEETTREPTGAESSERLEQERLEREAREVEREMGSGKDDDDLRELARDYAKLKRLVFWPLGLRAPTEVRTHLRASQKEMLLAVRSLLDAGIACLETGESPRMRRVKKIEID